MFDTQLPVLNVNEVNDIFSFSNIDFFFIKTLHCSCILWV